VTAAVDEPPGLLAYVALGVGAPPVMAVPTVEDATPAPTPPAAPAVDVPPVVLMTFVERISPPATTCEATTLVAFSFEPVEHTSPAITSEASTLFVIPCTAGPATTSANTTSLIQGMWATCRT
jgi:hypothetical protein